MFHLQQRLAERNISIDTTTLVSIASKYTSAAVILARGNHQGTASGGYYSRVDSNGDLVVLIVRDRKPITIMYRRSNQPSTADAMRVEQVIDLTH